VGAGAHRIQGRTENASGSADLVAGHAGELGHSVNGLAFLGAAFAGLDSGGDLRDALGIAVGASGLNADGAIEQFAQFEIGTPQAGEGAGNLLSRFGGEISFGQRPGRRRRTGALKFRRGQKLRWIM